MRIEETAIAFKNAILHFMYMVEGKANGLGIPKEAQKDIFQKFKRGSNVAGISGTGRGLAIVKASVEAHGGKVWLESKEGEGTAFWFTIPM